MALPLSATPRIAVDVRCELGENPLWHAGDACLYWTDIPAGRVYRSAITSNPPAHAPADADAVASTSEAVPVFEGAVVGGFTLQTDGALLLFMADGRIARLRADGVLVPIVDGLPEERGSRFNDVIADPRGRVFCGTLPTPERPGRLYRLDVKGQLRVVVEGVRCSNGLAFSRDRRHLYYTDSHAYAIHRLAYDEETGDVGPPEPFIRAAEADGFPDGLTRDADGCLWSARWGGHCVIRYDPDGREMSRLPLPVPLVTSVTFGGPDLTDLYITTAVDGAAAAHEPAGAVFTVNLGIRGEPEFRSRVLL